MGSRTWLVPKSFQTCWMLVGSPSLRRSLESSKSAGLSTVSLSTERLWSSKRLLRSQKEAWRLDQRRNSRAAALRTGGWQAGQLSHFILPDLHRSVPATCNFSL